MVMIEYRIDPVKAAAFIDAMQDMRRMRRRGGAFFWELFNDAERGSCPFHRNFFG